MVTISIVRRRAIRAPWGASANIAKSLISSATPGTVKAVASGAHFVRFSRER
jgi:hypothetical protein